MTLAIAAAMVLCWLLGILHPAMVGFIGAFLFAATGVDFDTAFHGFATETPWFLYGALLLAGAADRSGLTQFIGARTPRPIIRHWLSASIAVIVLAYLVSLVVPSSLAKATMLAILAAGWAERVPGWNRKPARMFLVLMASYAAAIFGHADLPEGPTAIAGFDVAAGAALVAAMFVFARTRTTVVADDAMVVSNTPFNRIVAAPVILAIALWLTTAVHGVSPALVGLACGLICWLPGIAAAGEQSPKADHLALVFAGVAITIPAVLIETKALDDLTRAWVAVNQSGGMLPASLTGYWSTVIYRMFSPDGARPSLPPLGDLLGSTAIWSYAGSTLFSLHQSPALILAMAVGGCRWRDVLTTGLFVLILGSAVVVLF
jgi:hypothetical protein